MYLINHHIKIYLIIFFAICKLSTYSQNLQHYSQFYNSPLTLNPALTGRFEDKFRIAGIIRQQWSGLSATNSEFLMRTPSGSFDLNLFNRRLGLGACLLKDEIGSNIFNTYRGYFSVSYAILMGDHALSFGVQPMYQLTSLDRKKLEWGSLIEDQFYDNISFFDLNAGVNYKHDFAYFIADFGVSVTHLLQPEENFVKNTKGNKVPMLYKSYVTLRDWEIVNRLDLHPGIFVGLQSLSTNIVYGSNVSYKLFELFGKPAKVYGGLWARSNRLNVESAIFKVGVGFDKTTFMASYDHNLNFSQNKIVTGRVNTFEFSVIHTFTPKIPPIMLEDNFILNPRF